MNLKNYIIMLKIDELMEPHCNIEYIDNDLCTVISKTTNKEPMYNIFREISFFNYFKLNKTKNLLKNTIYGFEIKPLSPKDGYTYIKVISDTMTDKS